MCCQLPADSLRQRQRKCGQGEELAEEEEEDEELARGRGKRWEENRRGGGGRLGPPLTF